MRIYFIIIFGAVLCGNEVFGDGENDVKRSTFPFMAFIYYPYEAAITSEPRFTRSAILIRPQWLISSSIKVGDSSSSFPKTTLLARVGAISIDSKITFNEDEEEQEREVIQVVRPFNSSDTEWWATDISLLKTLLPFNITSAVATTPLPSKQDYIEGTCSILLYTRLPKGPSDDRILMQVSVQLSAPTEEVCGSYFIKNSMACAAYADENSSLLDDTNFCKGNNGGPLVCGNKVMGLQTYIDYNCKGPYLYQLLTAWEDFITCGTDEKCREEHCGSVCIAVDKDVPYSSSISSLTQNIISAVTDINEDPSNNDTSPVSNYETISSEITDRIPDKDEEITSSDESGLNLPTQTTIKRKKIDTSKDSSEQKGDEAETKSEPLELTTSESSEQNASENVEPKSAENVEERERNIKVEAKKLKVAVAGSAASINISVLYYIVTLSFILARFP